MVTVLAASSRVRANLRSGGAAARTGKDQILRKSSCGLTTSTCQIQKFTSEIGKCYETTGTAGLTAIVAKSKKMMLSQEEDEGIASNNGKRGLGLGDFGNLTT